MARSKASGAGRLMRAECPTCELIAYLSRGAAVRHGLPVCACGSRLFFSKLDVQMEAVPELAHEHPDFAAYTERAIRSAVRAATHVPATQLRCGGCNAFVGATNERHSCGFHNDIRGNRNHGRWAEGTSRIAAAMPFQVGRMSDSLMSTCPGCGQTMLAVGARCDACAVGAYGGQERHETLRRFAPAPAPIAGQLATDAVALAGEFNGRGGLPKLRAGERVRQLLPNWDAPGTVVYTVEAVSGERATVRVPGLAGGTLEVPLSQLVRAR